MSFSAAPFSDTPFAADSAASAPATYSISGNVQIVADVHGAETAAFNAGVVQLQAEAVGLLRGEDPIITAAVPVVAAVESVVTVGVVLAGGDWQYQAFAAGQCNNYLMTGAAGMAPRATGVFDSAPSVDGQAAVSPEVSGDLFVTAVLLNGAAGVEAAGTGTLTRGQTLAGTTAIPLAGDGTAAHGVEAVGLAAVQAHALGSLQHQAHEQVPAVARGAIAVLLEVFGEASRGAVLSGAPILAAFAEGTPKPSPTIAAASRIEAQAEGEMGAGTAPANIFGTAAVPCLPAGALASGPGDYVIGCNWLQIHAAVSGGLAV